MQADRRLRAGGVARPSLLVGRGALLHAYRRGGGDLGADRRGRRLVPVRDEDRGRPPHGRGHAGPPLTGCRKNGGAWTSRRAMILRRTWRDRKRGRWRKRVH